MLSPFLFRDVGGAFGTHKRNEDLAGGSIPRRRSGDSNFDQGRHCTALVAVAAVSTPHAFSQTIEGATQIVWESKSPALARQGSREATDLGIGRPAGSSFPAGDDRLLHCHASV